MADYNDRSGFSEFQVDPAQPVLPNADEKVVNTTTFGDRNVGAQFGSIYAQQNTVNFGIQTTRDKQESPGGESKSLYNQQVSCLRLVTNEPKMNT